jgi:cold shock CspA family protein
MQGLCKFFNDDKNFGAVENEAGSWIFFGGDAREPVHSGDAVTFEIADDPRRPGQLKATDVSRIHARSPGEATPNIVFVANMPYRISEEDLLSLFAEFGQVVNVRLIRDRETGTSKGFAFIEMAHYRDALLAIQQLDSKDWDGRRIAVRQARGTTQTIRA